MKTRSGLPRHCTYQFDRDGKLAATRLANAGRSSEQIKAITGHRSDSGLAPYIRKANKARLARQARELVRVERERNLPKTETQVYPTAKKI